MGNSDTDAQPGQLAALVMAAIRHHPSRGRK
jgi:hypothetical protein